MRVLVLDNDKNLGVLLGAELSARGVETLQAETISQAQDLLALNDVGLLIVDGRLKGQDGSEFIERVRRAGGRQRIIYLSSGLQDFQTVGLLTKTLNVDLIVHKPLDLETLASQVLNLLTAGGTATIVGEDSGGTSLAPLSLEFIQLREDFGKRLAAKLADLGKTLHEAKGDISKLQRARTLAHRIRGSAGSYGFNEIGDLVGNVEDVIVEGIAQEAPPRSYFWEHVERTLRDAAREVERAPDTIPKGSETKPGSATRPLLVVDDDADFLALVRHLARRHSVNVLTAESAAEGIMKARQEPLLGALLDVHLEEELSFDVVRELRSTPGNANLPVVFASVDGRLETRVAALSADRTRFYEKPLTEETFAELLQQLLQIASTHSARILIVDDDVIVLEQYGSQLRAAGYRVETLTSATDLIETLEEFRPDVLLLDINMPQLSGIDICRALRSSDHWEFLPILLVSSDGDAATRLKAYRAGASDVILKPTVVDELLARVCAQAERMRLLQDRADRDALSGLMLRRAFVESAQRAIGFCIREKRPLSVVLIDIDHFKNVNDTYGHLAGDRVISKLGALLRRRFRIEDLRGRWGGEEFILAFPGQGADVAQRRTEGLLEEFSKLVFEADDGGTFCATFSAGVAALPENGETLSALIRRADELLYAAKQNGRRAVYVAPPQSLSFLPPEIARPRP